MIDTPSTPPDCRSWKTGAAFEIGRRRKAGLHALASGLACLAFFGGIAWFLISL